MKKFTQIKTSEVLLYLRKAVLQMSGIALTKLTNISDYISKKLFPFSLDL